MTKLMGQQLEFASHLTYTFVMTAARLSLLLLYRRVFRVRINWFRIAWWCCVAFTSLYFIALFIGNLIQCTPRPMSTLWTAPTLCLPRKLRAAIMGYMNAAIDLAILTLPTRMLWTLQIARKQKIAIGGVFGLGLMYVCVYGRGHVVVRLQSYRGVVVSLFRAVYATNKGMVLKGTFLYTTMLTRSLHADIISHRRSCRFRHLEYYRTSGCYHLCLPSLLDSSRLPHDQFLPFRLWSRRLESDTTERTPTPQGMAIFTATAPASAFSRKKRHLGVHLYPHTIEVSPGALPIAGGIS